MLYSCSALDDLEKKSHEDDAELKKQVKETQYIRKKGQEYRKQVQNAQAALDKTGVDPLVYHQALVARAGVRKAQVSRIRTGSSLSVFYQAVESRRKQFLESQNVIVIVCRLSVTAQ